MHSNKLIIYGVILLVGIVAGYMLKSPAHSDSMAMNTTVGAPVMPKHAAEPYEVPASEPTPTVSLQATPDTVSGWNLHITTTNFNFDPVNAGGKALVGRGHAHVFVDGVKVGRAYGDWYYLSALKPGTHSIRVDLVTNDHRDLQVGGVHVQASADVVQPEVGAPNADAKQFELVVKDKKVVSGSGDIKVAMGDMVSVTVTNDTDEEVHLHAYDVSIELRAGVPGTLTFMATASGRFPIELEGSKTDIGAVSVMPK